MEFQRYRMNLQFFADEDGGEGGNQALADGVGGEAKEIFTKSEVLQMVQAESDKRVQQALKTQQKRYEKELSRQKSLAGLGECGGLGGESTLAVEKDQTIAELQAELGRLRLENTRDQIVKVLSNRGMDAGLVDFVVTGEDAQEGESLERIDCLERIFKAMVKKEVDTKLRASGATPKGSALGTDGGITRERFAKMSITEQAEIARNNLELYTQLTKR